MIGLRPIEDRKDEQIVLEYLSKITENIYLIIKDDTDIGIVEYRVVEDKYVYIEYITIFEEYRENGYATETVRYLESRYSDYYIAGGCAANEGAYYFWNSLGADLELEDDLEWHIKTNTCIPFIL